MEKNKLIVGFYFGLNAHFAVPIIAFIVGIDSDYPIIIESADIFRFASMSLFSPMFWAGAIGGYLLGVKICTTYTESRFGLIKSIMVGLIITFMASAILGIYGGIYGIIKGSSGVLELALSPIIGVFGLAFFTFGIIYLVGSMGALLLHISCWGRRQLTK
jgi:hypothetical protein